MFYKVTVEPVIFLFMLSSFMLLTGLQDLIYTKVCLLQFTPQVCSNLYVDSNKIALDEVQTASSHWILGSTLLFSLPSALSAQFIGSWSDTFETKFPMIIPGIGGVLSTLIYIGQSVYLTEWPLYWIFVASFIGGICGGYSSCILTCINYIAKKTDVTERTARLGVLEGMLLFAGCLGPLLIGWITNSLGRSFVFLAIMIFQSMLTIYIIFFVRNITPRLPSGEAWWKTAFRLRHVRSSFAAAVRFRPANGRRRLLLLMVGLALVKWCHAIELDVSYIYMKDKPLEWNLDSYVKYLSLKQGIGALSAMMVLPRLKQLPDPVLLFVGVITQMAGLLLFCFASNSAMAFSVPVMSSLSSWALPVIRSAASKIAEDHEKGKLFACFSLLENVFMIFGSLFGNSVYPATRGSLRQVVFIVATGALVVPLIISWYLMAEMRRQQSYLRLHETEGKDSPSEGGQNEGEESEQIQQSGISSSSSPSSKP